MLFNSYTFLLFFTITFGLYYSPFLRHRQVGLLLLASSVFYAYQTPSLLLLLYGSILINALTSYAVRFGKKPDRLLYACLGVGMNLLILIFFKYSPLLADTFFDRGQSWGDFLLTIPLPIGISFYTFQGISLVVDAYRSRNLQSEDAIVADSLTKHVRNTFLYIAFFPQLIAGPIVKAWEFLPQVKPKVLREVDWEFCFRNLVIGYFLKVVVADNLKEFTFWIEYPYFLAYRPVDLLVMLIGYSCQIFADFAGYSTIAIGLAGTFGYKLNVNFNFPYLATSFRDFWKRWHISLSTFLMEYLYIPLGGSKKGKGRTYFNLFIVMALGGLWHGASWSYLVWGAAHGLLLGTERLLSETLGIHLNRVRSFGYSLFVFLAVTCAWLLFKLDFQYAVLYFKAILFGNTLSFDTSLFMHIVTYSLPVGLYHAHAVFRTKKVYASWSRYEFAWYSLLLFLIFFNSGSSGTFIYFQF